nr:inactive beta-amylase 4, chloroplastic-like [Malus domestica]
MDARENSRSSILPSSRDKRIPIYVMMPVDAFCIDGMGHPWIRKIKALTVALKELKLACVHGIAVEVWLGLKLHVALSFHSNVNSSSSRKGGVTLPLWIIEISCTSFW